MVSGGHFDFFQKQHERSFKAAPWDDINFYFLFCNEVVHPKDHDFIFSEFLDFEFFFFTFL